MAMGNRIDYSTLSWVKQEIDETLNQARHALEEHVENTEDPTQLRFCSTYIHQVSGTLQMVELYGGALLAEEMEHLAEALLEDRAPEKRDSYEVLMRAILQLPEYLERVQDGLADDPLVLLPLLNDLRAARGEHLLSENALFAPDISAAEPIVVGKHSNDVVGAELGKLAKKLRHQYQVGLVGWYRERDPRGSLGKLAKVLHELEQASTREEVIRLWWVANGVVEALLDEGLDANVSLKLLLGQIDREIKRLVDQGEGGLADRANTDLLKNLLYYVARSDSRGDRVVAVRQKFKLGGALPSPDELEDARAQLTGPNAAMMRSVSDAIREDLDSVKDALDLFLRSDVRRIEDLHAQTGTLRKVADTLGMLGLGMPRKIIQDQDAAIRRIVGGESEPTDSALMEIAGSLLFVESSLDGLVRSRRARHEHEQAGGEGAGEEAPHQAEDQARLPQAELDQVKAAVMKEVDGAMARTKESIVGFIDAPWDHSLLEGVPELFDQVGGALRMVGLDRCTSLLESVNRYLRSELCEQRREPASAELDTLADAIASIEFYLEAVRDGRARPDDILEVARRSVDQLGYPAVGGAQARAGAEGAASVEEADEQIVLHALGGSDDSPPQDSATQAEEKVQSREPAEPAPQQGQDVASESNLLDELDADILGIFVEEAEEELGAVGEALPAWKADLNDHLALGRIRRAFHTLKGSGRLVGAVHVGEYAWSLENMLNRVLDHTIDVTDEMVGLVEQSQEVVPRLVEALKDGEEPSADVQALMDRAFAVVEEAKHGAASSPEQRLIEEAQDASAAAQTLAADAQPAEAPVEHIMDPVLYEIFSKESRGHLDEIHQFLEGCDGGGACTVTDALIRSLHTLHGSARMAGVDAIAELSGLLERYAKALANNEQAFSPEGLEALVEGIACVERMLEHLDRAEVEEHGPKELVDRIQGLYALEQERAEAAEAAQAAAADADREEPAPGAEDLEHDSELVEVFLEEGAEILDATEDTLQRWKEAPDDRELVERLQRELHTLKGSARMAGVGAIGDLSHRLESLFADLVEARVEVSDAIIDAVHSCLDRLYAMLEGLRQDRAVEPAPELVEQIDGLRRRDTASSGPDAGPEAAVESPAEEAQPADVVPFPAQGEAVAETGPAPREAAPEALWEDRGKAHQEMVRVRAELLDSLVNNAGEVSIYRARLDQQIGGFRFNLEELDQTVARLRDQLRKLEIETEAQILYRYEKEGGDVREGFDPLEMDRYSQMQQLSRGLMETVSDIASIEGLMDNLVRESETLLLQQSRVNTDLQEGLMRTRMVPFTGMVPRMRRIVRQTCQELGKRAELHVVGADGEMDRTVLDRMMAPLEHMLRNAVSHGIEAPEQRAQAGKPETGNLTLSLAREGSEVIIRLADDGVGVDLEAIRSKAVERGLLDESAEVTDHDIMQFILESGFSTAREVTQISGRGVGMDVVHSEIKQLGGSLNIDSRRGEGATFTIRLPFTLAITQALLVSVGEDVYAMPLTSIEGIVRVPRAEVERCISDHAAHYPYAGEEYQVQNLGAVLGLGEALPPGQKLFPVLLVRAADHRMALQADGVMGSREIVVKSVGPQLSTVRGISGATILGDGRVVLILDVGALIRLTAASRIVPEAPAVVEQRPRERAAVSVMVVDDSITVRKVTSRFLKRNGLEVTTAKDGVDAVALLGEHVPDVMLLDIEMPRMDGFELATHVRNEPRLKHIPIIMITSRTGGKHRRRAREIGVDRYLGKPYQESDLLDAIRDLTGREHDRT
ncbi:MAG: response regulator [Gammaproteobacteria bacterium]|nr:response regulator [Gammaproteobacteria bacterium]NIR28322.1 response regulator [Gammaproteobacteria bacterium]NIR96736.1 response regulator [Gammaproteobacteria bacterium]NIT62438.1 response regulator [Gammaproteobacteria bacterium]NIV19371.1 response regulator [Gammaproteobacteria bacterium]